jgi:Tol biopolymer transport system component
MLVLSATGLLSQQSDFPKFTGPYLGQKPPGMIPEPFAPELRSTMVGYAFSSDGVELYFGSLSGIMFSRQENGRWTEPQTAPFSGRYHDFDFNFSPDGASLFFTSNRPLMKDEAPQNQYDIWVVHRTEAGWSEPINIGLPVNTEQNEVYPSVSKNGNLYFFRDIRGGTATAADIYCSKFVDGHYTTPEKLGDEINSEFPDIDPFIAPDESYLIFHSFRQDGFGRADLYISFRKNDGNWIRALNMGDKINTAGGDISGRVSPDGKYFFFTRSSKPYWVSADIIEEFRSKEL